ncbi:hypothetical protein QUF70_18340 [Desulfobacterales bacterium HSG17]|nr:hypothetical protein [Desulfobacterales bacterium HSG17]
MTTKSRITPIYVVTMTAKIKGEVTENNFRSAVLKLQQPEILPDPVPMNVEVVPRELKLNPVMKFLAMNFIKKWLKERVYFNHQDYLYLNEAYWKNYKQKIVHLVLSEDQTDKLIERCKKESVSVNFALTLAFAGAVQQVMISSKNNNLICVVGSLRERLTKKIGEALGFYAGFTTLKYKYNGKLDFFNI